MPLCAKINLDTNLTTIDAFAKNRHSQKNIRQFRQYSTERNKLDARNNEPYWKIRFQKRTLTIDDNGVLQTVSIDRIANAPSSTQSELDEWCKTTNQCESALRDKKIDKIKTRVYRRSAIRKTNKPKTKTCQRPTMRRTHDKNLTTKRTLRKNDSAHWRSTWHNMWRPMVRVHCRRWQTGISRLHTSTLFNRYWQAINCKQ